MSSSHLLKASTGCPDKRKTTLKTKRPSRVEAFRGCHKSRTKRRKMRFHGSPRNQMITPSKRPLNNPLFHGSRSSSRKTKKMTTGSSLKTPMGPRKKIGLLGVPNSKNSPNKETSSNRCSRRRKTRTTNTSTTNSRAAWILTVRKRLILNLSPTLHIQNLSSTNPSSKVTAQVRARVIHLHQIKSDHLTETLGVKGSRNRNNNPNNESAWAATTGSKTI